jgi:hypothetical protein
MQTICRVERCAHSIEFLAGSKKKVAETISESCTSDCSMMLHNTPVLQMNGEQQVMGLELTHHISSLLCLLSTQATALETLRSDLLAEIRAACSNAALSHQVSSGPAGLAKFQHKASHNQRLEELRNLQVNLNVHCPQLSFLSLVWVRLFR